MRMSVSNSDCCRWCSRMKRESVQVTTESSCGMCIPQRRVADCSLISGARQGSSNPVVLLGPWFSTSPTCLVTTFIYTGCIGVVTRSSYNTSLQLYCHIVMMICSIGRGAHGEMSTTHLTSFGRPTTPQSLTVADGQISRLLVLTSHSRGLHERHWHI